MKRKNILVIDVETANSTEDALVYDVGFIIADLHGNVKIEKSFVIKEIFTLRPELMTSAYYAEKVPSYHKELAEGKRELVNFYTMRKTLLDLMKQYEVKEVYAYNARFDRNALNTTYRYLTKSKYRWFFPYGTQIKCIWTMACDTILQQKTFRKIALREQWFSASGKFFLSNAETAYRYMTGDYDFIEEHKGLDDVRIEYEILLHARRQKKKMRTEINPGCYHKVRI